MVKKEARIKQRRQQAINLAGIYGAFLLATLVFSRQVALLGLFHVVFAGWFGYMYISKQVLGFLLYGVASALVLIGLVVGGTVFGVLWFTSAALTTIGFFNTVNISRTKKIL